MARILIVDDEVQIAKLLRRVLSHIGRCELAYDGGSGYLKYLKNRHDIIICDVAMPVADGLEMARKIRKISADVPIIVISAHSEKEKLLRAIDVQVNKYLIKPINPEELVQIVENLLIKNRASIELASAQLDVASGVFRRSDGTQIALSRREIELLRALSSRRIFSLEQIKLICWQGQEASNGSVRTLIARLRAKMGPDAKMLTSQSNLGYRLDF